ncbi:MAG: sigma-54 interaction domain-containing protein [bacterium]
MPFKILFLGGSEKQKLLDGTTLDSGQSALLTTRKKANALSIARRKEPQLVIVDFDLEELQPLEFLSDLMQDKDTFKVIGITSTSPLSVVVKAIKMGVYEVINVHDEPFKLQRELSKLFQQWQELTKGERLHQDLKGKYDFTTILGESAAMKRVLEIVSKIISRKRVTVLVRGETGTGKELIARVIHYNSLDQFQPFVEINCSALPESLLESELFGYEKGAFTDAKSRKKGLFELAQNGTMFLDEIGEITPAVQVKLLKALDEKRIRRVGGTQDIEVRTRIIAATNRDLQAAIRDGLFRNDLFYRLNVITIHLPALREREEDVLLLARHFLTHYAREYENALREFTPEAEGLLRSYDWPGNVRELKHTIERIVLLHPGESVTREVLEEAIESETPLVMTEKKQTTTLQIDVPADGMSLEDGEKLLIQAVLEKMNWNKRRTCQILKISRPRLDRKIQKYGLQSR